VVHKNQRGYTNHHVPPAKKPHNDTCGNRNPPVNTPLPPRKPGPKKISAFPTEHLPVRHPILHLPSNAVLCPTFAARGYNLVPGFVTTADHLENAMGEPSLGTPPFETPLEDRLDSWKEIAAYLKRDVTTVQRWEKREGMPVHRHLHEKNGFCLRFSGRVGRVDARPESSSCAGKREQRHSA